MYGPDELLNKHVHQLNKQAFNDNKYENVLAVCVNLMAKNNWLGLLQFLI
jgi:hypothetical protein